MSIVKLSAVLLFLLVANTFGQMSAEEAQAKLDEMQHQRAVAATQPGGVIEKLIKDNHDLQKENERLQKMLDTANDSARKLQTVLDNAETRSEDNDKATLTGVCPEVEVLYSCTNIDNNDFAGTFKRIVDMAPELKNEIGLPHERWARLGD